MSSTRLRLHLRRPALAGPAVAALLVAGALTAPATAATAAVPTCQGRAATVVGTGQRVVQGTEGDDVVVTDGATEVRTGDGDDLVCVTGVSAETVSVDTGAGGDSVTVETTALPGVAAELGGGADTFLGGDEPDEVSDTSGYAGPDGQGAGYDDVRTHGGDDSVTLLLDRSPADTVLLGSGDDTLVLGGRPSQSLTLRGGPGSDWLSAFGGSGRRGWVFDNVRHEASRRGHQAFIWRSFERFVFDQPGVRFRGGRADETVVFGNTGRGASMGRGDDEVVGDLPPRRVTDGGPGRDVLQTNVGGDRVVADLGAGRIRSYGHGTTTLRFRRFEGLDVSTRDLLRLVGTPRRDLLRGSACVVRAVGRGGDDVITGYHTYDVNTCATRLLARGGPGDDRLTGEPGDDDEAGEPGVQGGADRLLGGPGRDHADGGYGDDLCRAETRIRCER